jgi:hypothetical protein
VAPWSPFWDRNAFAQSPLVGSWLSNAFFRGAVTGVGIITALAGLAELGGAFRRRQEHGEESQPG